MKPLSNFDIERKLSKTKYFRGVFSRDNLPTKIQNNEYTVINLDDVKGSGTHWVCLINHTSLPYAFYFDSFGLTPAKEIANYMKTSGKQIRYNSSQIQHITSVLCGYYCVYLIKEFDDGRDLYDILYSFNQQPSTKNEFKMIKIFSK